MEIERIEIEKMYDNEKGYQVRVRCKNTTATYLVEIPYRYENT